MIETARARRRWWHAFTFPGIETDVMMVSARREKYCRVTIGRRDCESEDVAIKSERALEISDCEMHMSDHCLRMESHERFC